MAVFYNISSLSEDPSGIKVIENPTKTLKAVLFPRDYLPEFNKMTEANQALVFVEKGDFLNLNSAHAKSIESILINQAIKCGAVVMDNSTGSKAPRVQKADQLASATWADEVMTITKILGLASFVPQVTEEQTTAETGDIDENLPKGEWVMIPDGLYTMSRKIKSMQKTYNGTMEVRNGNCILKAGSEISPIKKNLSKGWEKKWDEAHKSGDTLTEDVPMDSPSGCAALVIGGTGNGWMSWKNTKGEFIDIYRKAEN